MKFMQVYSKIFEFNSKDKSLVSNIEGKFTISLEIELETDDKENLYKISKDKFIKIAKKSIINFLKEKEKPLENWNIVKSLLSEIDFSDDYDDDYNQEVFDDYIKTADNEFERNLYQITYSEYLTYWLSDNIDYLEGKLELHLPNFYRKWYKILKFELDNTLDRGIEFSPKKYLIGINKTIEYINDFYSDFIDQEYWKMTSKTGIHINIGKINKENWNILKGMLMISDLDEESYIFKDMKWRIESNYTNSFLPKLKKEIISDKKIISLEQFKNISILEEDLSNYILSKFDNDQYKNYGFNINRINRFNYVEFRYPGGQISNELIINKLYYFCYIVKLMTDEKFKRNDYLKKLYKFISKL